MNKDIEINETRKQVYARDNYTCQHPECDVSGWENLELAHCISKGKSNQRYIQNLMAAYYDKYVSLKEVREMLNHPLNLKTSCRKHNSYFNIGFNRMKAVNLLKEIKKDLDNEK